MLQHEDFVADTKGQRSAWAAFADNAADNRDIEQAHVADILSQRNTLTTLFRTDTGVGAFGVNQADRITSYNVCYTKLLRYKIKITPA